MKIDFIHEPELEFGTGCHVDVRFGIADYFPFDVNSDSPKVIRLGIIGTATSIEGLMTWLMKCTVGIPPKATNKPNLFPGFPGFSAESCFKCDLKLEAHAQLA